MGLLSVIVTAHNCGVALPRTLDSAATAVERLHRVHGPDAAAEIIVVDDGSTDGTPAVVQEFARGKPWCSWLRRPQASSPSAARNAGATCARGDLLCFLDGDDRFLPEHLITCYRALQDPTLDFVKTGVHLADPVHPDWQPRIAFSLVLNLCLRRPCHERLGGFTDYHLFRRVGEHFEHELDVFYKFEDMYYNQALHRCFTGQTLPDTTVEYCRYPGNAYDRQYAKFCRPYAERPRNDPEDDLRLQLCELLMHYHLLKLQPGRTGARPAQ